MILFFRTQRIIGPRQNTQTELTPWQFHSVGPYQQDHHPNFSNATPIKITMRKTRANPALFHQLWISWKGWVSLSLSYALWAEITSVNLADRQTRPRQLTWCRIYFRDFRLRESLLFAMSLEDSLQYERRINSSWRDHSKVHTILPVKHGICQIGIYQTWTVNGQDAVLYRTAIWFASRCSVEWALNLRS